MTNPLSPEQKQLRLLEKLTYDNTRLRSLNKKLLRQGGFAFDEVLEEIRGLLNESKITPFAVGVSKPSKIKPTAKKNHCEIAALVLSDFHLSEVINDVEVNGVNKYNSIICANRLWEAIQSAVKIIKLHQSLYTIEELWIPLLGDLIAGTIHPELELSNDLSDPSAVVLCSRLLQIALLELKTLGIPIRLDCIVGNHSRTTLKMPTKRVWQTNYDWLIYEVVSDYFKDDPQINFNIHTGYISIVKKYGFNFALLHGIDVKVNKTEALEDRIRAIFDDKAYRDSAGLTGQTFDQIIIGHLHTPTLTEKLIVNGSILGQSELGVAWRLRPVSAQQILFGISSKHPRTWAYNIDVSNIRNEDANNPMVGYSKQFLKKYRRA